MAFYLMIINHRKLQIDGTLNFKKEKIKHTQEHMSKTKKQKVEKGRI